jgi:hypothetical protein
MKSWILMGGVAALVAGLAGCSGGGSAKTSSPTGSAPVADLVVTSDVTTLTNTGTQTATVTITAVDASRNAVANAPITLVPDNNAIVTLSAATTDDTGKVTATLSIGSDHTNRPIDVIASSGSHTLTVTDLVTVVGAKLSASANATTLSTGEPGSIVYQLLDANSNPMVNLPIEVVGPTTVDGTTDDNGKFTYTYTAPSTPTDDLAIVANAGGATVQTDVTVVTSTIPVNPNPVLSASIASNVNNIPVNPPGSQTNQVTVRALFVGADNQPLQNIRVRFDLDGDKNNIGGTLSAGSGSGNPVYSDANGVATTTYIPGTLSSPIDGVTVRACWSNDDFSAIPDGAQCPANQPLTTHLTVTNSGVSLSIFDDALIGKTDRLTYTMNFAVQVVDSAGQAQTGVHVTGTVDLPFYFKGKFTAAGTWIQNIVGACYNEDVNRNGISEVFDGVAEDANHNGNLDPHKADVEIYPTNSGSDITDGFGKAYFTIEYGQNVASWVYFTLNFRAVVSGTEGTGRYSAVLPVLAADTANTTIAPPFEFSPYGVNPSGTIVITDPATGVQTPLCTDPG